MPTACDLTRTSSGPISGSGISATVAWWGASKIRAFIALLGSCRDQDLHVLGRVGGQALEARLSLLHAQPRGDDPFDGESSRCDLRGDPRPVVDAVAPAADD